MTDWVLYGRIGARAHDEVSQNRAGHATQTYCRETRRYLSTESSCRYASPKSPLIMSVLNVENLVATQRSYSYASPKTYTFILVMKILQHLSVCPRNLKFRTLENLSPRP